MLILSTIMFNGHLIVDDNLDIVRLVEAGLKEHGFKVSAFTCVTPLTYNVTMLENKKQPVFSKTFVTNGAPLSLELIAVAGNTTSTS